jgi:glycerophosphoryl diester phosphodiesterase
MPRLYTDDGDGFIVIAHRGASAYYPENTMTAFRAAVDMKAEMIELDVMLSKDGVPVVFHDMLLDNHTNGKGEVNAMTLAELKELDAGSWFDPKFAGERIPTLEEVLKFAAGTIALNIEIKTEAVTDDPKDGVVAKSLALVKKYGMEEYVLFSSFDYRVAQHLRGLDSEMPVALLNDRKQTKGRLPSELINDYKANAFNCHYRELTKKRLRNAQAHGIPVLVYTVDKESRMRKLLERGVSGIFTNKPDALREVAEDFFAKRAFEK